MKKAALRAWDHLDLFYAVVVATAAALTVMTMTDPIWGGHNFPPSTHTVFGKPKRRILNATCPSTMMKTDFRT
jgi:hypothetical protein